jgi:hypothetical protein
MHAEWPLGCLLGLLGEALQMIAHQSPIGTKMSDY